MRRLIGLAILSGVLCAPAASAFDKQGKYIVHGAGDNTSCREWAIDRNLDDAGSWQLKQWLLGYLTAYNEWVRGSADIVENSDAESVFTAVDEYCGANQTKSLSDAVLAFVDERR